MQPSIAFKIKIKLKLISCQPLEIVRCISRISIAPYFAIRDWEREKERAPYKTPKTESAPKRENEGKSSVYQNHRKIWFLLFFIISMDANLNCRFNVVLWFFSFYFSHFQSARMCTHTQKPKFMTLLSSSLICY